MEARLIGVESLNALARDLRGVADRKEILKALRKELREPVPRVRVGIKEAARTILPHRGGLGAWVASSRVTARVSITASSSRITLKAGRNSKGSRSDIRRIDAGRVRAPSWGRRGKGAWHTQAVPSGFMTETVTERFAHEWQQAAIQAADKVVRQIESGR